MESQSAQETNAPDWTERVWLLLSRVRLVITVGVCLGVCLWLFCSLIRDLFSNEGEFAAFPLYEQICLTLVFAMIISGAPTLVWGLLWCCSLLLMPPRFFRNSDSGRKLLQRLPAWGWRLLAIACIAMTVIAFLVED